MQAFIDKSPLSVREKIGYGIGDMASNFYMGFFGLFLLYYYTDVYGISAASAATMLLVTKIVDAVSDPMMGLLSDRTRTRWGRYRPYILFGAVPYALLGYLLFLGPEFGDTGKLIFAYLTYTLVMLAYTAVNVPYSGLLAVISPLAQERTKATQYRFIFASLGTLMVGACATPLVDLLGAGNELQGFRYTIILFAVLSVVLFWITFATTKERVAPGPQTGNPKEDLLDLAKNWSWRLLVIAGILIVVGLVARFASIVYYLKYYMAGDEGTFFWFMDRTAFLTSCGLIGQLLGALCTPFLVARFEKHHLMVGMNLLHALLLIYCFNLTPNQYGLAVVLHTVGIFTFGVVITLLFSMYTDCAEYGEWKTGKNTAGLTVSSSMFSLKVGSALGGALPGFLLAGFGFVANVEQAAEALFGIRIMFNLLPALFFFLGGSVMLFYSLNRETMRSIEGDLLSRRAIPSLSE